MSWLKWLASHNHVGGGQMHEMSPSPMALVRSGDARAWWRRRLADGRGQQGPRCRRAPGGVVFGSMCRSRRWTWSPCRRLGRKFGHGVPNLGFRHRVLANRYPTREGRSSCPGGKEQGRYPPVGARGACPPVGGRGATRRTRRRCGNGQAMVGAEKKKNRDTLFLFRFLVLDVVVVVRIIRVMRCSRRQRRFCRGRVRRCRR